jgi:putative redox protein
MGFKAEKEYFCVNESGNRVEIDMLDAADKQAMSPMQLLLSGLISCAAVDMVQMVKKRRKTLVDFSGVIDGTRRDEIPKKFVDIKMHYKFVSPDLTDSEAERIVDLAVSKYCSVASSIDPTIALSHSFEIVKP